MPIHVEESPSLTPVDHYWKNHTVHSEPFTTPEESLKYLDWRFRQYLLFKEFMGLYEEHADEVILDYGCGPGNDLVGFLTYTRAKKVIGIDISEKALNLARHRLSLHGIPQSRIELIRISDSITRIPIESESVNYLHCLGVLQHVSDPKATLAEFRRVMKANSRARVMVYNRNSIWFHLYTGYVKLVVEEAFPGMTAQEAFPRTTDGELCPTARCYTPKQFTDMCNDVRLRARYVGGYFSTLELKCLRRLRKKALDDRKLAEEHKEFIRHLEYDENGYPRYQGKHAGIGGVYILDKAGW